MRRPLPRPHIAVTGYGTGQRQESRRLPDDAYDADADAAAVAELADALDSGSSGSNFPWRFESSQPH